MGYNFPSKKMPNSIVKFMGLFDPQMAVCANYLGNKVDIDVEASITILGMKYKSIEETILALCDSLVYHVC